jgi:hypothetical protein
MSDQRHTARLVLKGHIIEKARGGQAPPAVPPPRIGTAFAELFGGGGPAKPGHADEDR